MSIKDVSILASSTTSETTNWMDKNGSPNRQNKESTNNGGDEESQFMRSVKSMNSGRSFNSKASFILETTGGKIEDDDAIVNEIIRTGAPIPPDGGYGWVIVFVSFVCNLVLDGITCVFGIFLPQIADDFKAGKGQVAWAGSILCGLALCIGPITSALTNKFGCRIVCMSGGVIAATGFAISYFATNLVVLIMSYGVLGAIGFGFIYLPNIVSVGYYFEKRRALATGIAVCGSGFGATAFPPIASWITGYMTWRHVNLIFSGLFLLCGCCGALIRPLKIIDDSTNEPLDSDTKRRPLLYRMAEDKKHHLEKSSMAGSEYFMVQLPDGTMERRLKMPLNVDPGVHSTFHLDQFTSYTPVPPLTPSIYPPQLTTISETEQKNMESNNTTITSSGGDVEKPSHVNIVDHFPENDEEATLRGIDIKNRARSNENDDVGVHSNSPGFRRQASLNDGEGSRSPEKSASRKLSLDEYYVDGSGQNGSILYHRGYGSQDGSVNNDDGLLHRGGERRQSMRAVPASNPKIGSIFSSTNIVSRRVSISSGTSQRGSIISTDDPNFIMIHPSLKHQGTSMYGSSSSVQRIIRPLSRKDIFYPGSLQKLPEYQSPYYRTSILNIPAQLEEQTLDSKKPKICPKFATRMRRILHALKNFMDFSLLKNPIFLAIACSGFVGMLGFHIPFVYVIDIANMKGIGTDKAAFLISIIGIMNTIGRVGFGMLSDLRQVNSLYLNNFCLLSMGISVITVPFCTTYPHFIIVYVVFGFFLSGFISLTSITLVDLLGLENLTNSFGLLIFFRGIASIIGSPFAGFLYDSFQSYDFPFYVAGSFLITSSLISSTIPLIAKFAPPRQPLIQRTEFIPHLLEDIPEEIKEEAEEGVDDGPILDKEYEMDEVEEDNNELKSSVKFPYEEHPRNPNPEIKL